MKAKYLLFSCFLIIYKEVSAYYEISLDRIESALGDKDRYCKIDGLRVKKFNRTTYVISGPFTTLSPLGTETDFLIEAYNLQGGQYKKIIERKFENTCKSLFDEKYRANYEEFSKSTKAKIPFGQCPYPAGDNYVNNYMFTDGGMLPPYIPGGEKWRLNIRGYEKDELLGGYNVYVLVRNEQSVLQGG